MILVLCADPFGKTGVEVKSEPDKGGTDYEENNIITAVRTFTVTAGWL